MSDTNNYSTSFENSASSCYLFHPDNFFGGVPPQSVVTKHFVENRDKFGYDEFPVLDVDAHAYEFFLWDDPEAEKVYKPFIDEGVLIEEPKLFQDDEMTEDELLKHEEAKELFSYYAKEADSSFFCLSSDDFEDPLTAFQTMLSNPFSSDEFASKIDETIHQFLFQSEKPLTDDEYSAYSTDVASTNLQILAKQPVEQIKVIREDSYQLSKSINSKLQPDQDLKNRLLFMDYLSKLQEDAREKMYKIKSISTALFLIQQNHVIDCESKDFERFIHNFYGSCSNHTDEFFSHLKNCGFSFDRRKDNFIKIRDYFEKFGKRFHYDNYVKMKRKKSGTDSPNYRPSSPFSELDLDEEGNFITNGKINGMLSYDDYHQLLVSVVSYLFFMYGDFNPDKDFIFIFFPRVRNFRDSFFRRFRIKYKVVYFASSYKSQLINDIDKFIKEYVATADTLFVNNILGRQNQDSEFEFIDKF